MSKSSANPQASVPGSSAGGLCGPALTPRISIPLSRSRLTGEAKTPWGTAPECPLFLK